MTVVLVSPFIDPEAVGEPRWCYDLARSIAARTEVTIVAQSPTKRDFRVADLFPGVAVIEYPPWPLGFLPRRFDAMAKPNYYAFYAKARTALRRIAASGRARCAHHFGPLGLRFPSPLRGLGIPYVFGPLGGSLPPPPGFHLSSRNQPWFTRLRNLDQVRWRTDPLLRSSYEDAACLVGVAPYVAQLLSDLRLRRFETQSEVCARPQSGAGDTISMRASRSGPLRLLCVARLVPGKGVQYLLDALTKLDRSIDWTLDVLGQGPMMEDLRTRASRSGLADRVTFHGHVPRDRVEDYYRDADLFVFPSIQEPSGSVIFEAMSWGLPIVVADYGGPAQHVEARFGVRVPVDSPDAFTDGFARAIADLARDPVRRAALGWAAVTSALHDHSFDAAADFYVRLYQEIGTRRAVAA